MLESCTWCGVAIEAEDCFALYELPGERRAAFCRLEHVVPWAMRGPRWLGGGIEPGDQPDEPQRSCSACDAELGDVHVLLVRHRGGYRVRDDFCGVEHLLSWAKAGGRFA